MIKLRQSIEAKVSYFDNLIRQATSEKVGLAILRDKRRWLCRNDLFYLCCLTNNKEIEKFGDFYKPFCDEVSLICWQAVRLGMALPSQDMLTLDDVSDNIDEDFKFLERLYLCYRIFYKTTIITLGNSAQLLLNFPNIHIVLCHNKQENASDNLVAIKNYFLTTDLRRLFPECIPNSKEWGNMTGFSLANRSDWNRVEDNIEAVGVDTEITGRHYDIAKKNDLVTEKSVTTDDQLKKTMSWDDRFNIGMFAKVEAKIQDYEGTRYHYADLYSKKKGDQNIKLFEIPIVRDVEKFMAGDDGQIVHPERFSRESVVKMMTDIWVFNCQMMLNPDDPAKRQFRPEMICYFSEIPKNCNFYLLVDPASKRKKKSDFTVMLVVGLGWIDGKRGKFIVDGIRDKIDPKQRVDRAMDLAVKWVIKGCGWEAIAFQDTDCFYFEEARRLKRLNFTPTPISSHTVAKEDRIRSLVPEYAQHQWFWPNKGAIVQLDCNGRKYCLTEELELELLQFPLCIHDDLFDAQTFLNRLSTIIPPEEKKPEIKGMTFGEYTRDMERNKEEDKKHPFRRFILPSRV